jgi:hypothetical protein
MIETKERPAAADEQQEQETEKPKPGRSGAGSFREAADRILQTNSELIVLALAEESKKGHIQSAKFLYDLADENCKLGAVEMIRTARSLAMQWTTEPLWAREVDEGTAETAGGSRELEG